MQHYLCHAYPVQHGCFATENLKLVILTVLYSIFLILKLLLAYLIIDTFHTRNTDLPKFYA